MPEKCVFCDLVSNGKETFVYEDDKCIAVLDKFPISRGHCLVISKEHAKDLTFVSDKTLESMALVVKKLAKRVDEKLSPIGIKVVSNIREPAGQYVMHLHIHIIPVYPGSYKPDEDTSERRDVEIKEKEIAETLKLLKMK
jgi:histidine triad (HIT) family protein